MHRNTILSSVFLLRFRNELPNQAMSQCKGMFIDSEISNSHIQVIRLATADGLKTVRKQMVLLPLK